MKIAVVGAGLTGATIANICARKGHNVTVFEKEMVKTGGMVADGFDQEGYIQYYGPHIFHTNNDEVLKFLSNFTKFESFDHKVIADTDKGFMPWPINIKSIKKSYGTLSKRKALKWLNEERKNASDLYSYGFLDDNFETKAVLLAGNTLYRNFIEKYTKRQWGRNPQELPSELINRVEIREDRFDSFFKDKFVGMPVSGYSGMIVNMFFNHNIYVIFTEVKGTEMLKGYDFIFNTAFCHDLLGVDELETIKIRFEKFDDDKYNKYFDKGYAVVNNCATDGNYTRVTNMNRLLKLEGRRLIAEIPSNDGYKLYPVRTSINLARQDLMNQMLKEKFDSKIINCGRCGGYKYINMDTAVELAFKAIEEAGV